MEDFHVPLNRFYLEVIDVLVDVPFRIELDRRRVSIGFDLGCDIILPSKSDYHSAEPSRFDVFYGNSGRWWLGSGRTEDPESDTFEYDVEFISISGVEMEEDGSTDTLPRRECREWDWNLLAHGDCFKFHSPNSKPRESLRIRFIDTKLENERVEDEETRLRKVPDCPLAGIALYLDPHEFLDTLPIVEPSLIPHLRGSVPWRDLSLSESMDTVRIFSMASRARLTSLVAFTPSLTIWEGDEHSVFLRNYSRLVHGKFLTKLHVSVYPYLYTPDPLPKNLVDFHCVVTTVADWEAVRDCAYPATVESVAVTFDWKDDDEEDEESLLQRALEEPRGLQGIEKFFQALPNAHKFTLTPCQKFFWDSVTEAHFSSVTHLRFTRSESVLIPISKMLNLKFLSITITSPTFTLTEDVHLASSTVETLEVNFDLSPTCGMALIHVAIVSFLRCVPQFYPNVKHLRMGSVHIDDFVNRASFGHLLSNLKCLIIPASKVSLVGIKNFLRKLQDFNLEYVKISSSAEHRKICRGECQRWVDPQYKIKCCREREEKAGKSDVKPLVVVVSRVTEAEEQRYESLFSQ